jgi:phosphatidylglycerophosphate synthase
MARLKLYREYIQSLKSVLAEEPLDLFVYRIISFLFVKAIYPTNITPNQLSIASLITGITSGIFFAIGTAESYIIAAILYSIYYLFDLSDGQVARLKKNGTRLGRVIDGLSDYLTHIAIYLGLAIGFIVSGSENIIITWLLLVAALLSLFYHGIIVDYYRNRYLMYALGKIHLYGDDLKEFQNEYQLMKEKKVQPLRRFTYQLYLKYLYLQDKFMFFQLTEQTIKKYDTKDFLKRNRVLITLWLVIGSSLPITLLIITAILNKINIYLYGIIIFINLYAVILLIIQYYIDKNTKEKAA